MSHASLILLIVFLMLAGIVGLGWRAAMPFPAPRRVLPPAPGTHHLPHMPCSTPSPAASADMGSVEWVGSTPAAHLSTPTAQPLTAIALDRLRVRERYIAARFPGLAGGAAVLAHTGAAIKAARLFHEDLQAERANELLALAIQQSPDEVALRLAQIQIAFLARDAELFTGFARTFLATFPDHPEWDEIARLGRALAPAEELFAADRPHGPRAESCSENPGWLYDSWDLTSDVLAADFHRSLANRSTR